MDYIIYAPGRILHISPDETGVVENTILEIPLTEDPLAIVASMPYPDVKVATLTEQRHYRFNNGSMERYPAFEAAGLAPAISISTNAPGEVAGLVNSAVQHYSSDGDQMIRNILREPQVSLFDPLALALFPDNNNLGILEPNKVRVFDSQVGGMVENPALSVTGVQNPKAFAVTEKNQVAIIEGNQEKHYSSEGTEMVFNTALSITTGLNSPRAIALRRGSYDRLIVDGDDSRYFAYENGQLVEKPEWSKHIDGLSSLIKYRNNAKATSLGFDPVTPAGRVRVRATHALVPGTIVTWEVSADGVNWVKRWRVSGTTGTCELSIDNGGSWSPIGGVSVASPLNDTPDLWAVVTPGSSVKWRATLETSDFNVTPKVKAVIPVDIAVVLEADARPLPPIPDPGPGACYPTSSPTFGWSFSDPDAGDTQSAFQILVRKKSDGALIYDSGKVVSSSHQFVLPTSTDPAVAGPLWLSGEYEFTWEVKVFDSFGQESDYSAPQDFCVIALERMRIAEIAIPPASQVAPDPADPSTHIMVPPGTPDSSLPLTKAGGKVKVLIDSIGPVNAFNAVLSYIDKAGTTRQAEIGPGTPSGINALGAFTNRWTVDFWTEASLDIVPTGTVVRGDFWGDTGAGAIARAVENSPYDVGVVRTQGSAYEEWHVVNQGRD